MNPSQNALFLDARREFHARVLESLLTVSDAGVPSNADKGSRPSIAIALAVQRRLGSETIGVRLAGQTSGKSFENLCRDFLAKTFSTLDHLRPGLWDIRCVGGRDRLEIARYEQYAHLVALSKAAKGNSELAAALGSDYTITPDIVVSRAPESDERINERGLLVDDHVSRHASLRRRNNESPLLHASLSCKWTIRSDRAQNARSEALNLIRNRKGRLPHVAVITGEPVPSRISSIALGTGDIDCVYHFALHELVEAVGETPYDDAAELLGIMISGKRLKDISDLPLDLAV